MYVYSLRLTPFVYDLLIVHKVILGTGTVNDIYRAVTFTVMTAVINHGAKRRKPDTSRNKEKILPFQLGIDRKTVSVRSSYRQLLSDFKRMQPIRKTTAFLDTEFHVFCIRRRRGYRKHCLSDAGHRKHGALSRLMKKGLFPVGSKDAEGFYIRRIDSDVGNRNNLWYQRFVIHLSSSASFFITFTIFIEIGHLERHLPQPTQPNSPSLLAGK